MAEANKEAERIDYLDGWRGLAIALVLQSHFLPIPGFSQSGTLGVDMFFCLSGLLMSRLLFVKRTPLLLFYERRINRIVPAFSLYVITVYLWASVQGQSAGVADLLSTLTFIRTYFPSQPHIWSSTLPIGHLWSLNVEEHSYLAMSLLALLPLSRRREGLVLLAMGGAALLVTIYYGVHPGTAPYLYYLRTESAASFIMISAGYSLIKDRCQFRVRPWMVMLALLAAACCYLDAIPTSAGRLLLCPVLLSFAVNYLPEAGAILLDLLRRRFLRVLGALSYSIYLWQQPFFWNRDKFAPGLPLALTLAVALLSFYLVENPARNWLNKRRYLVPGNLSFGSDDGRVKAAE